MDEETKQRLVQLETKQAKLERNQKRIIVTLQTVTEQQEKIIEALKQLRPKNDNPNN